LLILCAPWISANVNSTSESKSQETNETILSQEQRRAVFFALVGDWICNIGSSKLRLHLTDDNKFSLNDKEGIYLVDSTKLTLKSVSSKDVYDFELGQNQLTLSGNDLNQPLKFTKLSSIGRSKKWLLAFSFKSLQEKLDNIILIVIVVILCRIILIMFRTLIHFIIYSDWGPLKFIYRQRKNRSMTIYSLVINIAKYVVYILALGFVLSELGINYTAYLASLSVVGLAIGFGSQGLVQDMVTGFFIIFEGQFNVGDMVEIAPHVGIVEELGLRMTRLRNYLGQTVTIPNRNIAAVGNFIKGAQEVQIDVAVSNDEAFKKTKDTLKKVVGEISEQFAGTILSPSENLEFISLTTGESFVRLHLNIWPQQQWIVEQQVLPRIREIFDQKKLKIPNDRVIAFYHPRRKLHRPDKYTKPESKKYIAT